MHSHKKSGERSGGSATNERKKARIGQRWLLLCARSRKPRYKLPADTLEGQASAMVPFRGMLYTKEKKENKKEKEKERERRRLQLPVAAP